MAGSPAAILPLQRGSDGSLSSLTSPYTSLWQPLLSATAAQDPGLLFRIGKAVGQAFRPSPLVRLDALSDEAIPPPLAEGFRDAGYHALRFDHFGNWHEPLPESWSAYLYGRPAHLRSTIRRRTRILIADRGALVSVTDGHTNLEPAITAYQTIYAASWKTAEPFENFVPAYMREAASDNTLRLFILHLAGTPIAAQFWIVLAGCAHLVKLAHAETHRDLSPGTVLTAYAIEHLMQHDHVDHLDFGRGDDPYKSLWTSARRQRSGLLLANPRTLRGAAAIALHLGGKLRKRKDVLF